LADQETLLLLNSQMNMTVLWFFIVP